MSQSGTDGTRPVRRAVRLVRGVLAERVVVSTPLDPFLPLQALATYSGLSVRKLRDLLTDPAHPLPCYRIGGKILIRRSEFDDWMAIYRQRGRADVDKIVSDVLHRL
jgi:excisionase family DNA binding protein